ncbi:hypothetical protein [Cohnella laeviribosi]|uniref:hypothetical protein n=1 Tax=Cohnella laeviribosi TaxID=380174 RepID=UPI000376A4BE|nr:hypothetical protein [Cohnella laeviribosi]
MRNNNCNEFPTKKDMVYWLIILVLALVMVSVWRVEDPKKLSGQLSLGAALLSMLLAVVGIIIPFIQGNETSRQNFTLLEHISVLTKEIALYRKLTETYEHVTIKMAEDLKEKQETNHIAKTSEGFLIWQEKQTEINDIKRGISELSGSLTLKNNRQ